ncbi:MAG: ROK family protein [Acidimicrobiales bacterium]
MRVVGVDLGGTKVLARIVDTETGWSEGRAKASTPRTGPADVLDVVAKAVRSLDGWEEADAIGIGLPGLVGSDGVVNRCPNIAGWDNPVAVSATLGAALGKPVAVGNDVNCGALAEHRVGAGQGAADLLAVFVGTGVGGGLVLDGHVRGGARGMAGEIGHLTVEPGGRQCGCGGLGHLEAYAGKAGIEREVRVRGSKGVKSMLVRQAADGPLKSRHLAAAIDNDDDLAHELMNDAADALAEGIGNVATLIDLQRVVLGGGIVDKFGEWFVRKIVDSSSFGGFGTSVCELRLAERLDDAGVVGAAMLAGDQFE